MPPMYDDLSRPPLSRSELSRALTAPGSRWSAVEVVGALPSTNGALALRVREASPASGLVLIAEHQTAGRGRLDRTWTAPARSGITMSVLVRPDVPVARWPWISLLSGLAVAAAVRQVADVPAVLKWPNDVLVGDRKLAGVLVERVEGPAGAAAVIGLGINVTTAAEELPTAAATSLLLEGAATTDRATLVKAVLRRLDGLLDEWESHAGEPSTGLRDAYAAACSTLGRQVRVELPGGEKAEGEAVGIDGSGRLLVQTGSGQQAFGAGDVLHVRRPA